MALENIFLEVEALAGAPVFYQIFRDYITGS